MLDTPRREGIFRSSTRASQEDAGRIPLFPPASLRLSKAALARQGGLCFC